MISSSIFMQLILIIIRLYSYNLVVDQFLLILPWIQPMPHNVMRHWFNAINPLGYAPVTEGDADLHSSPKVMAVFLFLIFENFLIGGMFSILETIKTDRSTSILQNKHWCQMVNPMCTTFQMWQNCILQNQVCFERLISLSKTPYIFVKISKPRNWDPYSISAMSHGNRTSSYETVAHKLRCVWLAVHSSPKVMAVSSNIQMNMLDLLNFYDI